MDLRHLGSVLRSFARALILAAALGVAAGYTVSLAMPKVYEAESRLLVGQLLQSSNPNINSVDVSYRLSTAYATFATTGPLLEQVITDLGLDTTVEDLKERIHTTASTESPFVSIQVDADTPDEAAAIANAVAAQLIERSPTLSGSAESDTFLDTQLKATRDDIEAAEQEIADIGAIDEPTDADLARLAVLQERITNLRGTYAAFLEYLFNAAPNALSVVEPAVPPLDAASPRPLVNAALAGMLAVLVVGAIALAWDQLDDTVKVGNDIETLLGYAPIATIPQMAGRNREPFYRLVTVLSPLSPAAEAFRSLRTNLAFSSIDAPIRSIVVTSGAGGDGKSTVAANLAVVLAQEGRKVLLVDADLRRPTLHEVFRASQAVGLTSLLNHPEMTLTHVSFATEVEGLRLITSGVLPPNPVELLGSHRMEAVIKDLLSSADVVIIDTPPTGPVSDAVILSGLVDGVLLVAASRKTRAPSLRRASEAAKRASARVIGVVLNGVGRGAEGGYYGYNLTEANRVAAEMAPGITTAAPVTTRKS